MKKYTIPANQLVKPSQTQHAPMDKREKQTHSPQLKTTQNTNQKTQTTNQTKKYTSVANHTHTKQTRNGFSLDKVFIRV
jgi:hypothetical protein